MSRLEATSLRCPSPPRCPPNNFTASRRSDTSSNTTQLCRRAGGQVRRASLGGGPRDLCFLSDSLRPRHPTRIFPFKGPAAREPVRYHAVARVRHVYLTRQAQRKLLVKPQRWQQAEGPRPLPGKAASFTKRKAQEAPGLPVGRGHG